MFWIALLVIFSPVLIFDGLTLEKLWEFFNVHPFWFAFTLEIFFQSQNIINCKCRKEKW